MKLAALVAAAGKSERMGRAKALLPLGGDVFVTHLCRTLLRAGASPVVVTLPQGPSAALIGRALQNLDVITTPNVRDADGLLGSIATALASAGDADALLVCPIDMPFVTTSLVDRLVAALTSGDAALPVVDDERGHPVVFGRALFPQLVDSAREGGARAVLAEHASRVVEVPWGDRRVLANINAPEDFERWMASDS